MQPRPLLCDLHYLQVHCKDDDAEEHHACLPHAVGLAASTVRDERRAAIHYEEEDDKGLVQGRA